MPARILTYADAEAARRIVAQNPVRDVFVATRLSQGVLDPLMPGVVWGWPSDDPTALLHVGANLVPVAASPAAIAAFAQALGPRRTCRAIIGPASMVLPLWRTLCDRTGAAYAVTRDVRPRQPVMAISGRAQIAGDTRVRPIAMRHFESYLAASIAMYSEEVGEHPASGGSLSAYRAHCQSLIEQGRAFGIVVDDRVIFKSDIGAAAGGVAQLQGVWLDPALRGRGISAPAVASVVDLILADYNTVSLYVNDFNRRAIACYRHVGFGTVDEFATVRY